MDRFNITLQSQSSFLKLFPLKVGKGYPTAEFLVT